MGFPFLGPRGLDYEPRGSPGRVSVPVWRVDKEGGASGSGSGEGAGGSHFRWASELADLFGSSSPANTEAGLNQPAPV
ncbi:hypothetical protein KY285_001188 [Solanum tuberosum]|nr:hypothetical protein KY285_001188 [Solanum tuberosum]